MTSSGDNSGSQAAFLNVEKSALGQKWVERLDVPGRNTAEAISQQLDISPLIGRVLASRGVELEDAESFLNPALRDLMPDPSTLTDMDKAVERLVMAIQSAEQVAVFGDYDVDGACSAALMHTFLTAHGVKSRIYIPDRIFEGYGPNPDALETLVNEGASLIVTVDCGASSFEALAHAASLGADVVVLDHHQMGTEHPESVALVNPNRQDDLSGLGHLCAAGIVFMTLVATVRELRKQGYYKASSPPDLLEQLDLVALATVCDVVPLVGLNRAFVVKGLQIMRGQKNTGLWALAQASRMDGPPRPYHLGFVLGPRINAGGRIGDAALGSRLLTSSDVDEATEIAAQLEALNRQRQQAEAVMLEQALAEADAEMSTGIGPAVLVTQSDEWHPGIVGLLASRIKDRFRRPAIAIAFDKSGKGSGSGRSISGVNLGAAVRAAVSKGLLLKGGGHEMAAGLTVERSKLAGLRAFLEESLSEEVNTLSATRRLKVDGALTARGISLELIDLLEQAGPYGSGNPTPVFVLPAHQIRYAKVVGANHVSFSASAGDGSPVRGIAFRAADTEVGHMLLSSKGKPLHLAGTLSADFWQGSRQVQIRVLDVSEPA